jgi:hypothetical protein
VEGLEPSRFLLLLFGTQSETSHSRDTEEKAILSSNRAGRRPAPNDEKRR